MFSLSEELACLITPFEKKNTTPERKLKQPAAVYIRNERTVIDLFLVECPLISLA